MIQTIRRRTRRLMLAGAAATLASLALAGGAMADQPSSPTGMFVIGDQNATPGSEVTFWGAQWWTDNPLAPVLAPASFKGFADNATGMCGDGWSTAPGNSSHPPAPAKVSGMIPVIVSSQITQAGSIISGDTKEVVMVLVDSGYDSDPGHPGTGTVQSIVCQAGGGIT